MTHDDEMKLKEQLVLPLTMSIKAFSGLKSYYDQFHNLLSADLDFHGQDSAYASHNFHAFPAKFPPQLPRTFIEGLTRLGEKVLDPMAGSGTTVLEAFLNGRYGIGLDIDPLALRVCKAKVTLVPLDEAAQAGNLVLERARFAVQHQADMLHLALDHRFDPETRSFVDYWFLPETQLELIALIREIEKLADDSLREFFELALSAIIVTKSGGVSMARDLAHTRPHLVKDKVPRSALTEFQKRLRKNVDSLTGLVWGNGTVNLYESDAQSLPLACNTIDLIVTSPPYASNAIDYMRAHKFSLVWLGHSIDQLSRLRQGYIGWESLRGIEVVELPDYPARLVARMAQLDEKKAGALRRYYSEMTRCLAEMYRVLKPGKGAVVVVGTSVMRGIDTETHVCLGEIGKSLGFDLVDIAVRNLDRDKRMMPTRWNKHPDSQIEQRMHQEYVIGFYRSEQRG